MEIKLNMYHAVAVAAVLFWLGGYLTRKVTVLAKYCIPAPLVGGLCFALVNAGLYAAGQPYIIFDSTLQTVFMTIFFCTVGFTVSLPLLKKGGKAVLVCLILAIIMTLLQNAVGAGTLLFFGKDPRLGLAVGSISLIGGPGTAAAFGPELEKAGAVGGTVVGLASATFGLVLGSIMGGPIARRLIVRHKLEVPGGEDSGQGNMESESFATTSPRFVKGFMLIMLGIGIGDKFCSWLSSVTGLTFPAYIGAMLVAALVRNVLDGAGREYPGDEIETIGNMSLSLFLAMAMMGLKLWELADLALPMLAALSLQVLLMAVFSYFLVFRFMGRDYDAAVMVGGFIGFSMGATSNAMANMQAVTRRYGAAPAAFFVIPMVGSLFIGFVSSAVSTLLIPILGTMA